jgi:hypothetical protein
MHSGPPGKPILAAFKVVIGAALNGCQGKIWLRLTVQ